MDLHDTAGEGYGPKIHFDILGTYVTPWNKFRDLKIHFKSLGI